MLNSIKPSCGEPVSYLLGHSGFVKSATACFAGMCCAPTATGVTCDNDQGPLINEDLGNIEQSNDSFVSRDGQEVAIEIPSTVSFS